MTYAKIAAFSVVAFGLAVFALFQFTPGSPTDEVESVSFETETISRQQIGEEVFRLIDRRTHFLAFGQMQPVLDSRFGDVIDMAAFEYDGGQLMTWIEKVKWVMYLAPHPQLSSIDQRLDEDAAHELLQQSIAVVRFQVNVSDEEFETLLKDYLKIEYSLSTYNQRTLFVSESEFPCSFWRIDSATFLMADADRIRDTPYQTVFDSELRDWLKKFQTDPIHDDIVLVANMKPIKRMLARQKQKTMLRLVENVSRVTCEINFGKKWFVICRVETYHAEAAKQLRTILARVMHAMVGELIQNLRSADDPNQEEVRENRVTLEIVKSISVTSNGDMLYLAVPWPKKIDEWLDELFDEFYQSSGAMPSESK